MATITVSAYNDAAARTAGEAMTISGGATWTVRTDYRTHANAPASNTGSLAGVTVSDGVMSWDSTATRWLAYNTGTGNVPAVGTSITQGAVSGYLLGVWASKTVAKTAVGAAMPATGFIKLREVTGGAYAAGALSGIGASATGADVQGWLSYPHDTAVNFTVGRLGEWRARGGRFFLENTNGTVGQVFQVPTEGSTAMFASGLWIETGVGTDQYEFWPGLNGSTNGWHHTHLGQAIGEHDARQHFLKATAGGGLQMGETVTQDATYASLAAQAGTYAVSTFIGSYFWENNKMLVYCSTGHYLVDGQQVGLDFTSGGATADGIYTATVLGQFHFTVDLAGSGAAGAVTCRSQMAITFTAHGLNTGDQVYCDFTTGGGVDGTYTVIGVGSANVYYIGYPASAAVTAGNVSVLHSLVITFTSHGLSRGNRITMDFTSGTGVDGNYTVDLYSSTSVYHVRWPHSVTTSGNVTVTRQIGRVVEAGRRTWIGSNILNEVATAARATNTAPAAAVASRPEWITTSAGKIDLEYVYSCTSGFNTIQAYSVRMRNCSFFDSLQIEECATALDLDEFHAGMYGALDFVTAIFRSNFAGGTISNCKWQRGNTPGSSDHACAVEYCKGITFNNIQFGIIQYARSNGYPINLYMSDAITFNSCRLINGFLPIVTSSNISVNNIDYTDRYNGYCNGATGLHPVYVSGKSDNVVIDGLTCGLGNTIANCANGAAHLVRFDTSTNCKVRNIGTRTNPFPPATWMKNLANPQGILRTGGNCNNIKAQRCYVQNTSSNRMLNLLNSDKNILVEDCGLLNPICSALNLNMDEIFAVLNGTIKGINTSVSTTGQASVYGTHFIDTFSGPAFGQFFIPMNEPSAETASRFTMNVGTAKFNSSGGLLMTTVGWQATWEDDIFRQGHTGFSRQEVLLSGATQTRFDIHYQIDTGSGFSGWRNAYYSRAGGAGSSGAFTFTVTDATGVAVGDYIWGTGRGNPGKVTQINGNTITSDVANTATVTGVMRFNQMPSEVITPSVGFKLKVRVTCMVTETVAMTSLIIFTTTTLAAQQAISYPLDTNTITFTGLPTGCDMVVLSAGTNTILNQQDAVATTSISYTYSGAHTVDVGFIKPGYKVKYIRSLALGTADSSIPVVLDTDLNYA